MGAQGRRAASGPVWADWFLELEELLERRGAIRSRYQKPGSRHGHRTSSSRARSY